MMDLMKRYRQKTDSIAMKMLLLWRTIYFPLESASQIRQPLFESLAESQVEECLIIQTESSTSPAPLQEPLRNARISEPKSTKWPWTYFEISEFENPWIVKKSNKRKLIDREIRCAVLDDETGAKCDWKTTDSKPQASNINNFWRRIFCPG
ncbi:uncharacterized protein V1513DRAFT_455619 [Lipomyces chichibuensis]|uniref:uncharacterized protein n=1 Tax=Lipomyces chichibuensis TaxID=1546026 RepID=UPI003343C966